MNIHDAADQGEVFTFLADPATHGAEEPVRRIDTHGAAVFLAGADAYKVKRAVRYPFMDFSTLEKRKAACERELAVNRDNAPGIYLGCVPITRSAAGLALGGDGEVVEWAVHMRRFDELATFDHLAEQGRLTQRLIAALAHVVARAHDRAPRRDVDAAAALERYIVENAQSFSETPDLFEPAAVQSLTDGCLSLLRRLAPLLLERRQAGHVRRCHGDLHLRNIVLLDGEPVLFDALEFDEALATGDVLYDLAFLVMDLWERGLTQAANSVLNHYLWSSPEAHLEGLALLPLFLSVRAAIRAKVTAASLPYLPQAAADAAAADARRYFALAESCIVPGRKRLVAIGGLSGTGKTTVAAALAPSIGGIPGAVHLRTDIERKRMLGAAETEHLPQAGYDPAMSAKVYAELRRKARLALGSGFSVVADAVHAHEDERDGEEAEARAAGVPFDGLWLDAPLELRIERVEGRRDDASDATPGYVRRQASTATGEIAWRRVDASGATSIVVEQALAILRPAEDRSGSHRD